jgi:hypothetical protein
VSYQPLHYREITARALEAGLLETEGATPEASMNAQIIVDIKYKGNDSSFVKTAPATYALNPNRPPDKPPQNTEEKEEEREKIDSGYTGKAGEHLVCSHLLFRGYNASIMSVDTGLDIVATKDGSMIGIQVKTSNLNKFNTYVFDVRKVSFERHTASNVYYVFVLHGQNGDNFLILPYHEVQRKVHEKAVLEVDKKTRYRVILKFRDGKLYLGNMEHEMGYFLNNWELVR